MDDNQQFNNRPSAEHQQSPPPEGMLIEPSTPEETRKELKDAIKGSTEILAQAHTAMTPFPDTVTLDRSKLTITKRTFFRTAEIASIPIEDILNVTVHMGMIFSTIKVTTRVMSAGKPYSIGLFYRGDAAHFKNIAQGYVLGLQRKIDLGALDKDELVKMLDDLGKDDHPL